MNIQSRAASRTTIAILACALLAAILLKFFGGIVIIEDYTYDESRKTKLIAEGIELRCNAKPYGLYYEEGSLDFPNFGIVSNLRSDRDQISIMLESKTLLSEAKIEKVIVRKKNDEETIGHLSGYNMQGLPVDRPYEGIRTADVDPWHRFSIRQSATIRIVGSVKTSKTKEVIPFDTTFQFDRMTFTSFVSQRKWMNHIKLDLGTKNES